MKEQKSEAMNVVLPVRFPKADYKQLKVEAEEQGRKIGAYIRHLVLNRGHRHRVKAK